MMTAAALMRGLSRFLAVLAAAALAPALGQDLPVAKGEVYLGSPKAAAEGRLLTTEEEMPAGRLRLAAPSEREFRALESASSSAKRMTIGFGREVAEHAVEGSGTGLAWSRVGEWKIAKLRVHSPGAAALRVALRVGATRVPVSLRVSGSDDESFALGPVMQGGPVAETGIYWTPATEGEAQVVEIASPANQPEPSIEFVRVSHLVTGPSSRFRKAVGQIGASGSCNIDVACVSNPSQALINARNSVVHIVFTRPTGGTYLCTGTLLNDTVAETQVPYLFSANHCFDSETAPFYNASQMQQVANTLNSYFFFEAATCGSRQVPAFVQRFGGANFHYNSVSQDVLFVSLRDTPPGGAFLLGWDPNPLPSGSAVTVLHHPLGDLKKFSTGISAAATLLPSPLNASTGYWRVNYNQGIAEPGSSGAGLLTFTNGEYVVRGGLFGGETTCSDRTAPDYYSRFDIAYPTLRNWLNPAAGPAFDVTDLWWFQAESGWGINLTQHPSGQVFAVWYTYADDFGPYWLVMAGGQWVNAVTFSGTLYSTSGPHYAQPFDTTKVRTDPVGTMTLTFSDASNGSFTWTVNGVTGTKAITRQPF